MTGSLVYSRATKLYSANVTITNNGAAITSPFAVVLEGLTPGVTQLNASGFFNSFPYTVVNQALNPGDSVAIPLLFSNPANVKIICTSMTYQE